MTQDSFERAELPLNKQLLDGYSRLIREKLADLKIKGITVSAKPYIGKPDFFNNLRAVAFREPDENVLAMMVSGQEYHQGDTSPVPLIWTYPKPEGSSLMYSDSEKAFWTDSFFICRNNRFFPVVLDEPTQIGLADTMYKEQEHQTCDFGFSNSIKDLFYIAADKIRTRKVFDQTGIDIPPGTLITTTSLSRAKTQLKRFVKERQVDQVVLKAGYGSCGGRVGIFDAYDVDGAMNYMKSLFDLFQSVVLEERLHSAPPDYTKAFEAKGIESSEADFNIRSLVTIEPEPKIMGHEVRFLPKSNNPVNVSRGAHAALIEDVYSPQEIGYFDKAAIDAASALINHVDGGKGSYGFFGLDLMNVLGGKKYFLEANFGRVGGLGTISKLKNGEHLDFIPGVYLPSLARFLPAKSADLPEDVKRAKLSEGDYYDLHQGLILGGDPVEGIKVLNKAVNLYPFSQTLVRTFISTLVRYGLHSEAVQAIGHFSEMGLEGLSFKVYRSTGADQQLLI
jgi:hypothetical protein